MLPDSENEADNSALLDATTSPPDVLANTLQLPQENNASAHLLDNDLAESPTSAAQAAGKQRSSSAAFLDTASRNVDGGGSRLAAKSALPASSPHGLSKATQSAYAASTGQPPGTVATTKRFMNPLAERDAALERTQRVENKRRTVIPKVAVPYALQTSVEEELHAMGTFLSARFASMGLRMPPPPATHRHSSGLSGVRSSNKALDVLKDKAVDLRWIVGAAHELSCSCLNAKLSHSALPSGSRSAVTSAVLSPLRKAATTANAVSPAAPGLVPPPLPIVVQEKIYLTNEDARVLYRNGATRSGEYGVFCWCFEDEDSSGVVRTSRATELANPLLYYRDPIHDYILAEDAREMKEEDGGMMIPYDLKYLVREDHELDEDDVTDGDRTKTTERGHLTKVETQFTDAGEHRFHGRRNLLTLNLLRVWQHHHSKHHQHHHHHHHQQHSNKDLASRASSSLPPLRHHNSEFSQRSLTVLIDSPRSAFVLMKNGQAASDLAVSLEPVTEERRQKQIACLQREYVELCRNASQLDAVRILSQLPPPVSLCAADIKHRLQDGSLSSTKALDSVTHPHGVEEVQHEGRRPDSRLSSTSTNCRIQQLQERVEQVAETKTQVMARKVEQHRVQLASMWGKNLQAFTDEAEKGKRVADAVANARRDKILHANGTYRELQRVERLRREVEAKEAAAAARAAAAAAEALEQAHCMTPRSISPSMSAASLLPAAACSDNTPQQHPDDHSSPDTHRRSSRMQSTPLQAVREHHRLMEAERVRALEAALEAKDAVSRRMAEKRKADAQRRRAEQAARLKEVHETCERVKRSDAFKGTLLLQHQEEEERQVLSRMDRVRRLHQAQLAVTHSTELKRTETRELFQKTERELAQTIFYESQRRLQQQRLQGYHDSLCRRRSPHLSNASTNEGSVDRSPTPPGHSRSLLLCKSQDHTGGSPSVGRLSPSPRHRRKLDGVVSAHTKGKLVDLLSQEADLELEWKQLRKQSTVMVRKE